MLEAAELVENKSLSNYLKEVQVLIGYLIFCQRAKAFSTNDYYESDVQWMEVDEASPLEITIGPYEVYEDALYGYKAAFEAFICTR